MKKIYLSTQSLIITVVFNLILISNIFPQGGTYYNTISTSAPSFVTDLENRIRSPYNRISYDNFDETNIANFASINNGNGTRSVFCVYTGYEHIYIGTFTWGVMSREHTFAHSWTPTFPSTSTDQYSDQHHLFPSHQNNANGRRSNHPFGVVVNVTYQFLEGKVGTNSLGQIVYEPMNNQKGDVARSLYYMCTRYDGIAGNNWDFEWLNNTSLPSLSEAPQDTIVLLNWHLQDPPDKWEVDRNNYIQSIQQNRNPFVDHPEYVNYISFYNLTKVNPVYSAEPTNHATSFTSASNGSGIQVNWTDATGTQLPSGYLIVAYDRNNYFLPIDGSVYQTDSVLTDGRAVMNIPFANANTFNFNNLIQNTNYYFTIYSYNGSGDQINYKIDGTLSRTNFTVPPLLAAEPSNHVTNFASGTITSNSIQLNWTDALPGSQIPSGYLLLANTTNSFTAPSDGILYSNDTALSDGNGVININYAAPDVYSFSGLFTNTNYYFKIFSYNGSGSQTNYKTDGSIPFINAVTTGSYQGTVSVLLDNFNRSNNTILGNTLIPVVLSWQETETVNPSSIILNNSRSKLSSTTAGREFAFVNAGSIDGYPVTFSTSQGEMIWAINFRQSRSDPSGFDASNYGAAFILGKSSTDILTGSGYAVVIGNSGSTDPIRLARFTGGVTANSKFTNIISGGDYSNQYLSIKVVFEPADNTWSLYADSSSAGFPRSDPRNAATQIGFSSDNTFTSAALPYLGFLWNHATSANDSLVFDDVYTPSASPTTLNITAVSEGYYNVITGSLNIIDTMTAYLRNPLIPYQIVDSSKAIIDSIDFTASFQFENIQSGNYYIELTGKNTVETWSRLPQTISAGVTNQYNFTDSVNKAYGNNLIFKNGKYCIFSGDVNQDGLVDLTDLLLIYNDAANFSSGHLNTDINGDSVVDLSDLIITYNNSANFVSGIFPN